MIFFLCFGCSGFTILIFNTYTGAQVSALKGHLVEVCCLSWIALDSKLISMGVDGVIYTWYKIKK